ncbi:MAG: FxsA family protein [Actinomycetota bacterium]|nr:FxsA family protein [Actinomycetota bacterium]
MTRLLLFAAFVVVPLLELYLIVEVVGPAIGPLSTIALLLAVSVAGAALVRREGLRAWRRFREALAQSRLPAEEVVDGALVLVGGTLLVTPGFLTDAVGLLLVLPPTRALGNRLVRGRVRRAFGLRVRRPPSPDVGDREVVDVEVIRVERDPPGERAG